MTERSETETAEDPLRLKALTTRSLWANEISSEGLAACGEPNGRSSRSPERLARRLRGRAADVRATFNASLTLRRHDGI
jgi:hypothetical protein